MKSVIVAHKVDDVYDDGYDCIHEEDLSTKRYLLEWWRVIREKEKKLAKSEKVMIVFLIHFLTQREGASQPDFFEKQECDMSLV